MCFSDPDDSDDFVEHEWEEVEDEAQEEADQEKLYPEDWDDVFDSPDWEDDFYD